MIKRTLSIGKPAKIRLKNDQLVLDFYTEEKTATLPIEDIGMLVLDHSRISMTHGVSNALVSNNAAILYCDEKHLPNGLVLPLAQHSVFTEKLRYQLDASLPLKKQLWKQVVTSKIKNQAALLQKVGMETEPMMLWAGKVKSGDPDNLEGRAAGYYWRRLFYDIDGFTRGRFGEAPNNLLNYGYAILRGVVARSLVASGCLPAAGIHHHNKYNPFCLADDMMEPFRPYVDELVLSMIQNTGELPEFLEKEHKSALLKIPVLDIFMDGQKYPLMVGIQRTTASLMRCYEGVERKLLLPEL